MWDVVADHAGRFFTRLPLSVSLHERARERVRRGKVHFKVVLLK